MRRFKFSKLVRDKIVQSIIDGGNIPHWKTLTSEEYVQALKNKILEEAHEVPKAHGEELVQELADIQEIIDTLLHSLHISKEDFIRIQKKKNEKIGSFKNKQYIDKVETKDDSQWVDYYLKSPDKYPEIK